MRKSIAAAMSRSKREIPHYYLADEILMETALTWLVDRNAERSITERLLPTVLQLKAVALAAQRFAEFNGFWRDDGFAPAPGVHVGVAISLRGGGLVAPAIHDVPDKNLDELMANLTDLVARARAGSLRSSEMSDPSITVTNLGDQGVDTVYGVIYPPQVALVGLESRPNGCAPSTAAFASSPPSKPHWRPITGPVTATAALCSSPRSISCFSSPSSSRNDNHMTTDHDIRAQILSVLTTIAPEVEADDIRDDVLLRDQVDLDSMDWLNFLIGIHKRLRVDIPEADYKSLRTLTDVVTYVEQHAAH